jgi:transcriptional regulator with XRE-family HTH domain
MSATEAFIANINTLLKRSGLSQSEFSRRAGVSQTTFNRLINESPEESTPRLDTVEAIARGFGVSISELCSAACPESPAISQSPRSLAKQLGRLVDDFVSCSDEGKRAILRFAEDQANKRDA